MNEDDQQQLKKSATRKSRNNTNGSKKSKHSVKSRGMDQDDDVGSQQSIEEDVRGQSSRSRGARTDEAGSEYMKREMTVESQKRVGF